MTDLTLAMGIGVAFTLVSTGASCLNRGLGLAVSIVLTLLSLGLAFLLFVFVHGNTRTSGFVIFFGVVLFPALTFGGCWLGSRLRVMRQH